MEKSAYKEILVQENEILTNVLAEQSNLKKAVNEKNWTELMKVISNVNLLMDSFNKLDEERPAAEKTSGRDEEEKNLLAEVRGKLVRCRTENKALGDYINITRNFVKGIIDRAIPQRSSIVYSRNGSIVQRQPSSVVLNALY